jgi:hypothetical protein
MIQKEDISLREDRGIFNEHCVINDQRKYSGPTCKVKEIQAPQAHPSKNCFVPEKNELRFELDESESQFSDHSRIR